MRIYLQTTPDDEQTPKFYHLFLQEDLIEGWTLVKEWGNQGARGRIKMEYYPDRDQAEAALIKARDSQVAKGYKIMFVQGEPL